MSDSSLQIMLLQWEMMYLYCSISNLLLDHLTELPVVQLVIPAGVKLAEGHLDLLIREVGADRHELLGI